MGTAGLFKTLYKNGRDAELEVRNVFCVGRNYRDHAVELGNDVPTSPMIFGKPTHAVHRAEGTIALPSGRTNIHHELEIVLWMNGEPTPGSDFRDFVGGVALGLDLTDRDAQSQLKAAGHPWEYAKGFKNSALVSDFYVVDDWDALVRTPFSLFVNGKRVQFGVASEMIFSFQTLVDFVNEHFGLMQGDILFTGTPAGVGALHSGDVLELFFGDDLFAKCQIE
jgi:fumarylpyruvate hydrolase